LAYANVLWLGEQYGLHAFITHERIDKLIALTVTYAMGGMDMAEAIARAHVEHDATDFLNTYIEGTLYGLITVSQQLLSDIRGELASDDTSDVAEMPLKCEQCQADLMGVDDVLVCERCGRTICVLCAVECLDDGSMLCDLCWRTMGDDETE